MDAAVAQRHRIERVRRETRRRMLTVRSVERLTPAMQRIVFGSPDLSDFASDAPDDHIKLFLPKDGEPDGTVMRDYTPRAFDPDRAELTIDFALHDAGPATTWAMRAKVGDRLEIGGPRGSLVVADDFDWYLLAGDETALPAICRRLEELRPGVPATTFVLLDGPEDIPDIATRADWRPHWVFRDRDSEDALRLRSALSGHALPGGDGYVWIAAEASVARVLRTEMVETRGHPKAWLKASGYWVRGAAGLTEKFQD